MNLSVIKKTANHLKNHNIILPKISELANPLSISDEIQEKLKNSYGNIKALLFH